MPGSFFATLLLLFSLQVKRDFWWPAICGRFICALTSNLHRVHFDFSSNSASTLPQWLSTDAEHFCVGVNKSGTAIPRTGPAVCPKVCVRRPNLLMLVMYYLAVENSGGRRSQQLWRSIDFSAVPHFYGFHLWNFWQPVACAPENS